MMDNPLAEFPVAGSPRDPGTFPELSYQNGTSVTSRFENTKVEADVYRALGEFGSDVSIVDARAIVDQRLLAVRYWSIWLDLVRKLSAREEFASRTESGLAATRTSGEALRFCLLNGMSSELGVAIDSARKHFSIVGSPSVTLVHDPEVHHASYLVIEIQVRGTVRDNVASHREFARETAKLLGTHRGLIKLHYDII